MEKIKEFATKDNSLKSPYMRHDLIATLRDLSCLERQKRNWPRKDGFNNGFWWNGLNPSIYSFENIHFDIENEREEQIGNTIRTKEEFDIILDVFNKLWKILEVIGCEKSDTDYVNSPLWDDVVQSADKAYNYIKEQELDKEYTDWLEKADPI